MTPVSRSGAHSPAVWPSERARSTLGAGWHVLCILPVVGCLYVAPIREGEVNEPPTILLPEGAQADVLLFADLPVVVAAADAENDPLVFLWSAPGYGLLPSNERQEGDLTTTSTAVIPYDPALDGRTVECLVIDQSEAFNDVLVEFFVELQ